MSKKFDEWYYWNSYDDISHLPRDYRSSKAAWEGCKKRVMELLAEDYLGVSENQTASLYKLGLIKKIKKL